MAQNSSKKRYRLFRLWCQCRNCHWCGQPTVLLFRPHGDMRKLPRMDDEATIDHLYPRGHPERRSGCGEEVTVLACHRCNAERNEIDQKSKAVEYHWERSGSYPRHLRGGLER